MIKVTKVPIESQTEKTLVFTNKQIIEAMNFWHPSLAIPSNATVISLGFDMVGSVQFKWNEETR